MSYSAIEILSNVTPDKDVAKNHHIYAVPDVQKSIAELEAFITEVSKNNDNGEMNETISGLTHDLSDKRRTLNAFIAKWPLPTITPIEDEVMLLDEIPVHWHQLPITPRRPSIPLILRNETKTAYALFYSVPDSDDVLKVTNMHYNHPNEDKTIEWHF